MGSLNLLLEQQALGEQVAQATIAGFTVLVLVTMAAAYLTRAVTLPSGKNRLGLLFTRIPEIHAEDVHSQRLGYHHIGKAGDARLTSREELALESPWQAPDWSERVAGIEHAADHPTAVARDGLRNFTRFLDTGEPRFIERLVACADWLVDHQGDAGEFKYGFPYAGQPAGWVSGLGQGAAISTLTRAYQQTGRRRYLDAAYRAQEFMLTPVADGGTLGTFDDGSPVVEEAPGYQPSRPQVLNGAISAYFGLHDLARVTGDLDVQKRLEELIASLKQNLYRYRAEPLSRYDTRDCSRANLSYHRMHVVQLRALSLVADDTYFAEVAEQYARQVQRPIGRFKVLCHLAPVVSRDGRFHIVLGLCTLAAGIWATAAGSLRGPSPTIVASSLIAALSAATIVGLATLMTRAALTQSLSRFVTGLRPRYLFFFGVALATTGSLGVMLVGLSVE